MSKKEMDIDHENLIKRYLIWCYKTTKEELDRVDRKVTQLKVDYFLLDHFNKNKASIQKKNKVTLNEKISEFEAYIEKKEKSLSGQRTTDSKVIPEPQYVYLKQRLCGIEKAIQAFLGKKELKAIQDLYQDEMITRILQAREH